MSETTSPLIATAADLWVASQQKRRKPLASNTIASYCDGWRSFAAWANRIGRKTISDLQAPDLGNWIDSLNGAADGTAQTYSHGALAICKYLADRGLLPCDLALLRLHLRDALPRAHAARAPDVPDLRQIVGFYDAARPAGEPGSVAERERLNQLRNAALMHLLFSTGARISELLALDVRELRNDNGAIVNRIYVVGKGERRRAAFVRQHAQKALEAYLLARRVTFPQAAAVFISHGPRAAGERLSRVTCWKIVTDAAYAFADQIENAGRRREARELRSVTPHTFRHFVATWLLNEGAQMSEVSAILGHANTRITEQYYARHRDAQLQELHDQFAPDPRGGE
jgi:site-specific recombinase XerD